MLACLVDVLLHLIAVSCLGSLTLMALLGHTGWSVPENSYFIETSDSAIGIVFSTYGASPVVKLVAVYMQAGTLPLSSPLAFLIIRVDFLNVWDS